jgi:hypothetical protein
VLRDGFERLLPSAKSTDQLIRVGLQPIARIVSGSRLDYFGGYQSRFNRGSDTFSALRVSETSSITDQDDCVAD